MNQLASSCHLSSVQVSNRHCLRFSFPASSPAEMKQGFSCLLLMSRSCREQTQECFLSIKEALVPSVTDFLFYLFITYSDLATARLSLTTPSSFHWSRSSVTHNGCCLSNAAVIWQCLLQWPFLSTTENGVQTKGEGVRWHFLFFFWGFVHLVTIKNYKIIFIFYSNSHRDPLVHWELHQQTRQKKKKIKCRTTTILNRTLCTEHLYSSSRTETKCCCFFFFHFSFRCCDFSDVTVVLFSETLSE